MPFALRTWVGPRNHLLDIAKRFEPNTVLWAFYIIQPSSFRCLLAYSMCDCQLNVGLDSRSNNFVVNWN